jgi:hypothetical protein
MPLSNREEAKDVFETYSLALSDRNIQIFCPLGFDFFAKKVEKNDIN